MVLQFGQKLNKNMHTEEYFKNADKERLNWLTKNKFIVKAEKILLQEIKTEGIDSILEVGCGEGANIYNLCSDERKFVGIDINYDKLGLAALFLKKTKFVCTDALNLPFQSNSFDLVFCRDVFHHVSDRNAMLEEMLRVCKRNGRIIIIEANGKNLFWNVFGSILSEEKGVKKNTILEFERLLLREYADNFSEITIKLLKTPMFLRLLAHYKFGFKELGNNRYFLRLADALSCFKMLSSKKHWPYIIAMAIKK